MLMLSQKEDPYHILKRGPHETAPRVVPLVVMALKARKRDAQQQAICSKQINEIVQQLQLQLWSEDTLHPVHHCKWHCRFG